MEKLSQERRKRLCVAGLVEVVMFLEETMNGHAATGVVAPEEKGPFFGLLRGEQLNFKVQPGGAVLPVNSKEVIRLPGGRQRPRRMRRGCSRCRRRRSRLTFFQDGPEVLSLGAKALFQMSNSPPFRSPEKLPRMNGNPLRQITGHLEPLVVVEPLMDIGGGMGVQQRKQPHTPPLTEESLGNGVGDPSPQAVADKVVGSKRSHRADLGAIVVGHLLDGTVARRFIGQTDGLKTVDGAIGGEGPGQMDIGVEVATPAVDDEEGSVISFRLQRHQGAPGWRILMVTQQCSQGGNTLGLKEGGNGDLMPQKLFDLSGETGGNEGMAAHGKKVGMDAEVGAPQSSLPDPEQLLLQEVPGITLKSRSGVQ